MGDSLLTGARSNTALLLRPRLTVSIPFSWGTHFSRQVDPAAEGAKKLLVSIPFSWGTHFSRQDSAPPGAEKIRLSLNPLLMGDSLLTSETIFDIERYPLVSIPFSWGTHFSRSTFRQYAVVAAAVSIPFSWGTHFSLCFGSGAHWGANVSQSPSHGGLTSHVAVTAVTGLELTDRLNPLLMGDSLLTEEDE